MEHHPLLKELLEVCATHNVELAKAYNAFEVFQELCLIRKLSNLNYHFNEELKLLYLSGKQDVTDEANSVYVPVMYSDEITPREINEMQEILSPEHKQLYLLIRDRDSSSTCYRVTRGLVRPDSPETCKRKKEIEKKKYQFEKTLHANRRLFYTKALKRKRTEEISAGKSEEEKIN